MKREVESKKDILLKYIFIFLIASFAGRFYEFYLVLGEGTLNYVRYFPTSVYTFIFSLPYGIGAILLYRIVKLLDKTPGVKNSSLLKILICIALVDLVELITGLIALNAFGIMPWDYSHHFLNYKGLISLPTTIRWAIIIGLLGGYAYKRADDLIKKPLSKRIKWITLSSLCLYGVYLAIILSVKLL